jgi:hypothetical protein
MDFDPPISSIYWLTDPIDFRQLEKPGRFLILCKNKKIIWRSREINVCQNGSQVFDMRRRTFVGSCDVSTAISQEIYGEFAHVKNHVLC